MRFILLAALLLLLIGFSPAEEEIGSWFRLVDRLHAHLSNQGLSLSTCAFSFAEGYEDEWRFVRHQIRYIPYNGIYKSPEGVLLSGEGNSLEKALLLARLLEAKGFSVKICYAASPEAGKPFGERPLAPPNENLADLAQAFGIPPAEAKNLAAQRRAEAEGQLAFLQGRTESRLEQLREFIPEPYASASREKYHYWVRVVVSPEKALDLDPTLGDAPGWKVGEPEETVDPAEPAQDCSATLDLRLLVEQGESKTELLHFQAALADCCLKELHLGFIPSSLALSKEPEQTWESYRQEKRFVSVLNFGGAIQLGHSFDLAGNVFVGSGDGRVDAAQGLGQGLAGVFGGGGDEEKASWNIVLQGELVGPEGGARFHRELVTRGESEPHFKLISCYSLFCAPGPVRDEFFVGKELESILANQACLRQLAEGDYDNLFPKLTPYPAALHAFARSLGAVQEQFFADAKVSFPYALFGYEDRIQPLGDGTVAIRKGYDIISCPLLTAKADPSQNFLWGLALTELERLLIEMRTGNEALSPSALFLQARAAGIELRIAHHEEDLVDLEEADRRLLAQELEQGLSVVFPEKPLARQDQHYLPYYTIDPTTGFCLGKIFGRGQALAEYVEKLDFIMSLAGAISSFNNLMQCMTKAIVAPLAGKSQAQIQHDFARCMAKWALGHVFNVPKGFVNIDPTPGNVAADIVVGGIPESPWSGFTGFITDNAVKEVFGP